MYVFSRDSYIGETCTGLEHDENRETPEQGSLISALPRAIQVILVLSMGLQVFPGPKNVSPASLESFLCEIRIPAGFVPSGVRFSYYNIISSEADSMKILNKDGKNPGGNVPQSQNIPRVPLGMRGSPLDCPWMPINIRNQSDRLFRVQNQSSLLRRFPVCVTLEASVSTENTAPLRKSIDPQDLQF